MFPSPVQVFQFFEMREIEPAPALHCGNIWEFRIFSKEHLILCISDSNWVKIKHPSQFCPFFALFNKMATKAGADKAAKVIKLVYVGIPTKNFGRPLWEIVLNLKNFGVGRYVTRTTLTERYPEPTFYKILSVVPQTIEYPPGKMNGSLWVEATFRGRVLDQPLNLGSPAWKDDFQLVPKHEEKLLMDETKPKRLGPTRIVPRTAQLPPLWKLILHQEKRAKGEPIDPNEPEPEIELIYDKRPENFIQIAKEGQEPDFKVGPGTFKTNNSPLYDNVIWKREEAIAKYNNLKPIWPTKGHSKFQLPEEVLENKR